MLRAFLRRVGSEPWLVLFTSDHGEAFGEHKAIHHGQNTYDEQIHVPGFVAFGNGALDPAQEAAFRSPTARRSSPVRSRTGACSATDTPSCAQAWDADFRCVDLTTGAENANPASKACGELRRASRTWWVKLPSGRDNR